MSPVAMERWHQALAADALPVVGSFSSSAIGTM